MENFNDSKNWKYLFFYFNPNDPRIMVPKKIEWMGTTFNYAHKISWIYTFLIFLIIGMLIYFLPSH